MTELQARSNKEFARKGLLVPNPNDVRSNTVFTFTPGAFDPVGQAKYEANPSRFQLTRTETDLNMFYTYISLEVGTTYLQIPTADRWGMTTDQRGSHITIAYLADMDDNQLRDLNNKLKEVVESW